MKKIIVIVNKKWEAAPVLEAMKKTDGLTSPVMSNATKAFWKLSNDALEVALWCIEDMMIPEKSYKGKSAKEKNRVIKDVVSIEKPDLIIAVGTAAFPGEDSQNGSVVVGSRFFLYDGGKDSNSETEPAGWEDYCLYPDKENKFAFKELINSNVSKELFDVFAGDFASAVEQKFLKVPYNSANPQKLLASAGNTALSNVNVLNNNYGSHTDKKGSDYNAIAAFREYGSPASIETTHGIIKVSTDKPIIFVSAIANRVGYLFEENGNKYPPTKQTDSVSFNAGIVIGEFVSRLSGCSIKSTGSKF